MLAGCSGSTAGTARSVPHPDEMVTRSRRPDVDLTNPGTVHAVARRVGLLASKRRGQHFLIDRDVLDSLVGAFDFSGDEIVLEIGCGLGTLTGALAAAAGRVVAIDVDPACVNATLITQRRQANVEVFEADARFLDLPALGLQQPWCAAGNLPYRLTGAILSHLFERANPPRVGVFLVQREVAHRMCADAGGWSLATVALRSLARIERLRDVGPESFDPPPAVHSSVVRLHPLEGVDMSGRAEVLRLARRVFQQRRKTLRHGVTHALGGDGAGAARALEAGAIDPQRRPGTLSLDEWDRLARAVATLSAEG
jgi:16S rRNA (adenine1518-N6/adenine1519-N6)-dimethyltransferase